MLIGMERGFSLCFDAKGLLDSWLREAQVYICLPGDRALVTHMDLATVVRALWTAKCRSG